MRHARGLLPLIGALAALSQCVLAAPDGAAPAFVRVSPRDARYFELADGAPYIPIGLNMIAPPGPDLSGMERWMEALAAQGGNFIRVWLGNAYFDVEHARSGVYDEERAARIEEMLAAARRHGLRVKMCIESFRHFGTSPQAWADKKQHLIANGGPARDIADFFDGEASRAQFRRKLDWLAVRFGDDPTIFGWELWNEINAVAGGDYMAWTEAMLGELHKRFPHNLAMQSLGSFDRDRQTAIYESLTRMPGNDVAQVHRYLDLGAQLEACKGPVDVLAADAVGRLLAWQPGRPVLLAESGAVEPAHTGPFKLYAKDTAGVILHDVLFAPFFSGAAGPGHCWHWKEYVDKNNLWPVIGRFAEAVRGIDPPAEAIAPALIRQGETRVYVLRGRTTTLAWVRDGRATWRTELEQGLAAPEVKGESLDLAELTGGLAGGRARVFDPWTGQWGDGAVSGGRLALPEFRRSLVIRVERP